jgi:hypothetical protein
VAACMGVGEVEKELGVHEGDIKVTKLSWPVSFFWYLYLGRDRYKQSISQLYNLNYQVKLTSPI